MLEILSFNCHEHKQDLRLSRQWDSWILGCEEGSPKRCYPTTSRSEDGGSMVLRNVGILPQHYTVWRWRQQCPPKRRYPTTTLHGLKMEAAMSSETSVSYHNTTRSEDGGSNVDRNVGILQHYTVWRWRQQFPPKRRYPTTTLRGITPQKTSTWTTDDLSAWLHHRRKRHMRLKKSGRHKNGIIMEQNC
jgi:hypothetical protein